MPFNDPTPAYVADLDPTIAPLAVAFINGLRSVGVPAWISSGRRNAATEASLVASGRSTTMHSKHLTGQAFDYDVLGFGRDQLPQWWMLLVGQYGESLGLTWGGRWTTLYDPGHFQVDVPPYSPAGYSFFA
ncbi:MAG: M15 family metallopeptidase [Candidatus Omnitrophica bacterium]|nr:M15 family metallopeptidase [Candidatus Omnitrophota bacterium]